jgi:mannan endo-1,4-beta-mannosidase
MKPVSRVCFQILGILLMTNLGSAQFANFITAKGDKLMDGSNELRFISVNIPNLHYVEDYLPFAGTNPWRLPDEFEIRDALTAVKQLGGKAARTYVFSVRRGTDTSFVVHVEGPGKFNEEAFKALDKVIQIANETGVRLIIPFIDNWHWWGGVAEYAAFRGKQRDEFWTDSQLREDFKKTVEFVVNRVNTYTGVPYKNDKAILAWETGNELLAPFSWTKDIAAYIKSLDTNHLVLEGTIVPQLTSDALEDPNLDILSSHHYRDPKASIGYIVKNRQLAKGKKPYIVGEYGIVSTEDIRALTDTIINQGLSGGMIWSLRFRNREGGFYHHYEYNNVESYRWPGFPGGDFYDERVVLTILREKAHQIDGTVVERLPVPAPPILLPIADVSAISFQGSAGAETYVVERKTDDDPTWKVLDAALDDSRFQYRPLFADESAVVGKKYSYRIKAQNGSGQSGYSNVIGPVETTAIVVVDEMENFDKIFQKDGNLKLLTTQDLRKAKEDRSRLAGDAGSYIIYKIRGAGQSIKVDYLVTDPSKKIVVSVSKDPGSFTMLDTDKKVYSFGKNDYGFYDAVSVTADIPAGSSFIKVSLEEGVQIGRIELRSR